MGEGVKRRAAGRVGRQVFIPRVGCGIKTGSTGVLAGLPGPQKQKGATVRQGMSSQEARVSLFGDLTRVSFYGERQGLFFRGTQQPGGKNDIAASSSGRAASPSSQAHRNSARYSLSSRAKRAHERPARPLRGRASPQPFKAPGSVVKRRVKFKATGRVSSVTGELVDWDSLVGVESECAPVSSGIPNRGAGCFRDQKRQGGGKRLFCNSRNAEVPHKQMAAQVAFSQISRGMACRPPIANKCRGRGKTKETG